MHTIHRESIMPRFSILNSYWSHSQNLCLSVILGFLWKKNKLQNALASTVHLQWPQVTEPTPRFSPYYWPDTPTKPLRDRSFPCQALHSTVWAPRGRMSPKSLWLILIYLIDFEFGPQLLVPHFSPIQDVDSMYHMHSLGSSKSKIGFIVLGFCKFQPQLNNQKL
jgi:hypothetical protein